MKRLFKVVLSVMLLTISIAGCDSVALWHDTSDQYDSNKATVQASNKDIDTPPPAVVSKHQAYVDTKPVSLSREPDWYNASATVNGARLPFNFYVAQLLGSAPVDVHTDPGVNPARPVTMHYNGTVKGALAELAAKSNYFYDYDLKSNTITWSALETKTFDISFIPGVSKYSVGNAASGSSTNISGSSGSSGGGSGGSSSSIQYSGVDVTQTGEYSNIANDNLSVWDDMKATIETLLSPKGKLSVSQATTTVTVRDHPSNVSDITHYLDKMNKILSKQVHFDVQVLDVQLNKQFQYGINWNNVAYHINSAGSRVTFNGNFADSSGGILSSASSAASGDYKLAGGKWTGDIVLKALQEQGKVSIVTQPSLTTLNDQVAQISIQTQQSYLASQSTTISGGDSSLSQNALDPGVVTYGFQMYILPKIQGDKVYLQISSTLSDLISLTTVTGTGQTDPDAANTASSIQVPNLAEKTFNQRSVLRNGQTLVLAGFRNLKDNNQKDTVAGLTPLGGLAAESNNEELVVLITPRILSGDNF